MIVADRCYELLSRSGGPVRIEPDTTVAELRDSLRAAAAATWGNDAVPDLEATLGLTAQAIWRVCQEPLEPSDVEP
jgi:hypothetical protein